MKRIGYITDESAKRREENVRLSSLAEELAPFFLIGPATVEKVNWLGKTAVEHRYPDTLPKAE